MTVPDPAAVERFAAQTFTAEAGDGAVSATVSGAGDLVAVEIAAGATRGEQRDELGARVVAAVNAAFDERDRARAAAFGLPDRCTARQQADALVARMDALSAQLTGMRTTIADRSAQVRELRQHF